MKMKFTNLLLLVIFVSLTACGSADKSSQGSTPPGKYVDHFKTLMADRVEFDDEKLTAAIDSPFESNRVHPLGKVSLEGGTDLVFVMIAAGDEPLGVVNAELITNNQRSDKIKVAESDVGYYQYANVDLPLIHVFEDLEDVPVDTVTYRISGKKFERL